MGERSSNRKLVIWSLVGCAGLAAVLCCLVVPVVFLGISTATGFEERASEAEALRARHEALAVRSEGPALLVFRPVLDEDGLLLGAVLLACRAQAAELVREEGRLFVRVHLAPEDAASIVSAAGARPGERLRVDLGGNRVAELSGGAELADGVLELDASGDVARGRTLLRALVGGGPSSPDPVSGDPAAGDPASGD